MKSKRISINNIFTKIVIFILTVASVAVVFGNVVVFADNDGIGGGDDYGGAGGGGGGTQGCQPEYDKWGGCYYSKYGYFWLRIDGVVSDDILFSSLGLSYLRKEVRNGHEKSHIYNCAKGGNAVYILVARMWKYNGDDNGVGGGMMLSETAGYESDGDGLSLPPNASFVAWEDAKNKFAEHADYYWSEWHQKWDSNSELSWFCAEPPISTSKTTTTTTSITNLLNCGAYESAEKADTRTRIAVQNMSLDGTYPPKYSDGSDRRWVTTGGRSGLTSDSLWTAGGDDVETLAKPGDTVRFYHAVCMAVRYGRWTPVQDTWGSSQSHSEKYTPLPAQSAHIGATPSNYLFEDKGVLANVNRQMSNVEKLEPDLFSYAGVGTSVNAKHDAIDILQPTKDFNGTYDCSNVSQYANRDPYKAGGYQIPGFASGQSCNSASATGISNATGTTIQQWHTFDSLKMWEQFSHKYGGSCGCGDSSAWFGGNRTAGSFETAWRDSNGLGHRKTYACQSKTTKDCDWVCTARNEYGTCIDGYWNKINYPYKEGSFTFKYHSTHENYGTMKKTATVYVPYNFLTTVTSGLEAGNVTFQGGSISSSFHWSITPRANNRTSSFAYATTTPANTEIRMIEFLYAPGDRTVSGNTLTKQDPCSYYESKGGLQCTEIESVGGIQNKEGYYVGQSYNRSHTRLVPDNEEYVGFKYCVAVGIWPSDSHDRNGNELWQQKETGLRGAMDAGEYWNISGASCRTIAKKPNFQVWNGSVYTEGSINTSYTKKMTGKSMGTAYNANATTLFGSWADYAIAAKGNNNGMASGAMLGYSNGSYNFSGGGQPTSDVSVEILNPETIANTTNPTGNSNVTADSSIKINLQRLKSRYSEKAQSFAGSVSSKTIKTAKTGMQYAYVNGDASLSQLSIVNTAGRNNQTASKDGSGNLVKGLGDGINDNTLVIYVDGTFTIDRNICYGSSCGNNASKLRTYESGTSTNKSAALPQILIFADNVNITEGVTRVDAWLVVDNGTINTCSGHKFGDSANGLIGLEANDAGMRDAYKSYGNCDKTLVINGPVYANHLSLMRTAGAFHSDAESTSDGVLDHSVGANRDDDDKKKGAVAPAEIFNLRADAYIWAYNQAQRYSEAVVTYTRELAPRY